MGSAYSANLEVTSDVVPSGMTTLTADLIQPKNITVSWPELVDTALNGGDLPDFYLLEYFTNETNTWIALNNPATDSKVLSFFHSKGGALFIPTFTHLYRVKPRNRVGWGTAYSAELEVVPNMWPTCMNAISATDVQPWSITIAWAELTQTCNGGVIPYYYQVEWYNTNTTAWEILTNEGMGTYLTFTHTRVTWMFPSGSTQKYRVIPKNEVDMGSTYSNELSVPADSIPTTMSTLTSPTITPT